MACRDIATEQLKSRSPRTSTDLLSKPANRKRAYHDEQVIRRPPSSPDTSVKQRYAGHDWFEPSFRVRDGIGEAHGCRKAGVEKSERELSRIL